MSNKPEWIQELRETATEFDGEVAAINLSPRRILELLSLLDSQKSKLEEMERRIEQFRSVVRRVENQHVRFDGDQVHVQMWYPVWQALTDCLANSSLPDAPTVAASKRGEE